MLIRLAANLVWLGRYLERTENMARLVLVANGMTLTPEYREVVAGPWLDALAVTGGLGDFAKTHALGADDVSAWLIVDRTHLGSLGSCLRAARDNARTARHLLTDEYWEAINGAWLEAQAFGADTLAERGTEELCSWAIARCQQVHGAAADLLRDSVPRLIDLGRAVERGDHLARLLAVFIRGDMAVETVIPDPGSAPHRRWEALLASAGLLETYRRAHTAAMDPHKALHLILAHPGSPRALETNIREIPDDLMAVLGDIPASVRAAIDALIAHLGQEPTEALAEGDLPAYLTQLGVLTDACGAAVSAALDPTFASTASA